MKQTQYPIEVPSHAGEHIALLFLGLIVALSAMIGYEIVSTKSLEQATGVMAMQGLLGLTALGAWSLLRRRRLNAELRKAKFLESLGNG